MTAALHHVEMKSHPERISKLRKYGNNYDWSRLKFPMAINKIGEFEKNNDTSLKIEMPKRGSLVKFHDGQHQFKVPFFMYADFEAN